jgi:hypothetical protein
MPKQEAGRLAIWFRELSKALDRSGQFVGTGDVIAGLSAPLRTKLSQARLNLFGVNYPNYLAEPFFALLAKVHRRRVAPI